MVVVPPVLLLPWTLQDITGIRPCSSLRPGWPGPGLASSLAPRSLLLLSPGGPGLPPFWVTGAWSWQRWARSW